MPRESDYTSARPDCPHPERWNAEDAQATEWEVIDMVAHLVGGLQPDVVIETGTYHGWMAQAIGIALRRNGQGTLVTMETDAERFRIASANCAGLPVVLLNRSSMSVDPDEIRTYGHVGFAWFDSLTQLRVREFEHFLPLFDGRTIVGFHDTGPHHGPWSHKARVHPRLRTIDLPTPRGVILGQVRPG